MEVSEPTPPTASRQLRLLSLDTGLGARLGREVFRSLPAAPGVYFFYDAAGTLLYIGQSCNLHARVGSYRHVTPEQHPKRTLRLVRRIARVEWRTCGTADEAIELEGVLLLEHRPPFNRAGVWEGSPWWLSVRGEDNRFAARLSRTASPEEDSIGPLHSGFRYAHAALMRCVYRLSHPARPLGAYPLGLLNQVVPLELAWPVQDAASLRGAVIHFLAGEADALFAQLAALPAAGTPIEQQYWDEQVESLQRFQRKRRKRVTPKIPSPAAPLPLFPLL